MGADRKARNLVLTSDAHNQQDIGSDWLPREAPPPPSNEQQHSIEQWDEFNKLAAGELATSAARWQEGLAAVVGVAAAALLVVNAPDATSLPANWRPATLAAMVVAAATGVVGLWCSLMAVAGVPVFITKEQFETKYGTVDGFRRARMRRAATQMRVARWAVIVSITTTMLGAGLLWMAPRPAAYLQVETETGVYCGTVKSGDRGQVLLEIPGEHRTHVIELAAVRDLWATDTC